jgi:hypothetical protein
VGQKVLAEGQLTLAGDFQGCCIQSASAGDPHIVRQFYLARLESAPAQP